MEYKEKFRLVTKEEVTYLAFTPWIEDQGLSHGFSTKFGGVSSGAFASLNLGFNRGDDKACVIENYKRISAALEVPFESLVLSKQVHELNIAQVHLEDKGNGILKSNKWESMDGLYTREKGVTLVTHYADCVPLFFYAPKYGIIGMAHAGWRGTVGEIGRLMIERWVEKEQIPLKDIQVAIGPSIGPCCFQVDEDVKEPFMNRFGEDADFIRWNAQHKKYHIDLWQCNKKILIEAGISEENIITADICTCCYHELFFSHRYTKGHRGTLGAFMCLK